MTAKVHKLPTAAQAPIYADNPEGRFERVREAYEAISFIEPLGAHMLYGVARDWLDYASEYVQTHPEPGMHMTYTIWTDRVVYEIVRVNKSGTKLWARRMRQIRLDKNGMCELQSWAFASEPGAPEEPFTYRKGPRVWKRVGDSVKQAGGNGRLGYKHAYHDFSF